MTRLAKIRQILTKQKPLLREKYGVEELGIFGSYLRGKQRKGSDLDLLVQFSGSVGLLEFIHIENYLSDLLGVKVDLVMKDALKPRIGQRILQEVEPV
jgi:predicted nucleotidyltransferase